ncbi:hypothetical protein V2A60_007666 [Cordyceps javanica]|uniref:Transcription factor AbaA n=1 Tax=Cordyceps javanica TaxID=43265 RepID=A0A545W746_9HYPO|nr:transcription factor AbaA [Cordyceps javanica]TQW09830.1 transcription factor AbaA [Cordyceps javanica]
MSSLYPPRPMLSSQRYHQSTQDYVDARRSIIHHPQPQPGAPRAPLRESTGNAQAHSFNGMISCYQSPVTISPPIQQPPQHIQAPMVPSQSFDCLYRVPTPRQPQPQQQRYQRKPKADINPLYFWPAFRQYRNRQAHKDTQKDKGGVWRRPELEDAFVDSVLLMPHMGRRKFSMGGKLHGRNMLISEYIFTLCVAILGSKEIFRIDNSNDSIEQMGRKQVSSHMQVVKKFFEDLRCFHFLFPSEEKKEPGSTNSEDYYDEEEQESFKSNPILTALAEGRVPEVKPNYPYFSQLLNLQAFITVRPKTCEIFVSSSDIKIRDEIAYDINDTPLDQASFPHLNKYNNCDDSPNVLGKDVLLHEYTRSLDHSTSASVKTVTRRWQKDAPAMYETLELPSRDEDCLLLEMCATLELHEHAKFPSGSELTGFVEVAITQQALQNHQWKCVTRLTRPAELHSDESDHTTVYTNESGIHRRGCSDSKPDCDCHTRSRADIHVPFPAVEWASILSMAVQYPDTEHQRAKEKRMKMGAAGKKHAVERAGSKRKRSEDDGDAASWARREPTGSDLICKVAMYQELWSRAPDSPQWQRQGIIFWRFNTTNQWYKYEPVFKPAGTSWRWLTINDPMSRYHQQKALVYPPAGVPRDAIMSPTPTVGQHLTANMNETFHSAWDQGSSLPHVPTIQTSSNAMGLFDSFSNGLATPPPSATLPPAPYSTGSFDSTMGANFLPSNGSVGHQHQQQQVDSRHGSASLASGQSYFDGGSGQVSFAEVKPSLPAIVTNYTGVSAGLDLATPGGGVYDNSSCDTNLQAWDMPSLDAWPGTGGGPTPTSSTGAPQDWPPPPPAQQQHQQPQHLSAKLEHADHHPGIWAAPSWNVSAGVDSQGGSPRQMKRRRTDVDGHVPVSAGW